MAFDDSGVSTPAMSMPRRSPPRSISRVRVWVTALSATGAVVFIAGWLIEQMLASLVTSTLGIDVTGAWKVHSALFLAAAVALCGIQVLAVWRFNLARRWWYPFVLEFALAVGIAITSVQALGSTSSSCSPPARCITTYPPIVEWPWSIVCVTVGVIIATSWARATQQSRR